MDISPTPVESGAKPTPEGGDDAGPAKAVTSHPRLRNGFSFALVVIACVLLPLALISSWSRRLVQDEDAYLRAVGPLATNADVVAAVQDDLAPAIINQVDKLGIDDGVTGWLRDHNVPTVLVNVASDALGALRNSFDAKITSTVATVVGSPEFANLWVSVNQLAHQQLQALVNGNSALRDASGGLSIPLQPVVAAVRQRLVDGGNAWAAKIPDTDATIALVSPEDTAHLRDVLHQARILAVGLVVAVVVLLLLAVLLATDRWRAVRRAGYGALIGTLLMSVLIRVVVHYVGNSTTIPHPAAVQAVIQTVTDGLRGWIQVTAAVAIILVILSWAFGKDRSATRLRSASSAVWNAVTAPKWLVLRRLIAGAVAAVAAAILLFVDLPLTGMLVLLGVVVLALLLLWAPGRGTGGEPMTGDQDSADRSSGAAVHL